ncbi:MAG: PhnD/SsuA/transferrin family substrate-binding protein [Arenicella sp.]
MPYHIQIIGAFFALLLHHAVNAENGTLSLGIPTVPDTSVSDKVAIALQTSIKHKIRVVDDEKSYLRSIRTGLLDAFFAEPHIGAWAIRQQDYNAIAKLPKPLYFRLIAKRNQNDIFELRDLKGRPVCSNKNPALSYRFLVRLFPEQANRPETFIVNPQRKTIDIIEQPCLAFIVTEEQYINAKLEQKFITLARSKQFTHLGFFVRSGLPQKTQRQLLSTLTQTGSTLNALTTYFSNSSTFVPADNSDYPDNWQTWLPNNSDWPQKPQ